MNSKQRDEMVDMLKRLSNLIQWLQDLTEPKRTALDVNTVQASVANREVHDNRVVLPDVGLRKQALKMADEGFSSKEIAKRLSNTGVKVIKMQVAGWRAHATRGTYKK